MKRVAIIAKDTRTCDDDDDDVNDAEGTKGE